MIRRYLYILFAWMTILLVGCDVHQWPEQSQEPATPGPSPDYPKMTIPLSLEYETDFYVWEHRYDPLLGKVEEVDPSLSIFPDFPGASSKYESILPEGKLQVYVKVFPTSNPSRCIAEQTFTRELNGNSYDTDLEIEVQGYEVYDIVVWSQFLAPSQDDPFYDSSNFNKVQLIPENYRGNTDYRDGFRGRIRVDATTEINGKYVVRMNRPMGKFELVTTDLSEFLDRETELRKLSSRARVEDYRVIITFPYYFPSSYSAMDDRLENSVPGVSFETRMTVTGESEASLGFEYVMLNNMMDNGVQASVNVYRMDGTRVAGSSVFTIPMRRDYHTLLRGAFLAMEGSGGVGIDPSFNGDHNITWQ